MTIGSDNNENVAQEIRIVFQRPTDVLDFPLQFDDELSNSLMSRRKHQPEHGTPASVDFSNFQVL